MRPSAAAVLLLTLAVLASAHAASACSCVSTTPEKAFDRANVVFRGTVVNVNKRYLALAWYEIRKLFDVEEVWEEWDFRYGTRAEFEVQETWKGAEGTRLTVATGRGGGDCGYPFEEDEEYVVFAYLVEGRGLVTHICSHTLPVRFAEAELRFLDRLPSAPARGH